MAHLPETRYAKSRDGYVAYQVLGEGDRDVVLIYEFGSPVELQWEMAEWTSTIRRFTRFARVIVFNRRGVGLSDPVPLSEMSTMEPWVEDVRAVMDAAGSDQAVIVGLMSGGVIAMLFAATYPNRVQALVLCNTAAKLGWATDYPWGIPEEVRNRHLREMEEVWGTGALIYLLAPSVADERLAREMGRWEREGCGKATAVAMLRASYETDVRGILSTIQAPTLVVATTKDWLYRQGHAQYLADHIPGAELAEFPGDTVWPWSMEASVPILGRIEEFLTGARGTPSVDRVLATVMFTDIVGSTERAAALGDRRWRDLLDTHNQLVRRQLERFRGQEISTAGDGCFATFDSPGRAVQCAWAIRDAVISLGIDIRAGLHTGEIELRGGDAAGMAVHIGARVLALAKAGEVLVSSAIPPLLAGSGIEFEDRGDHNLRGVPGTWKLYSVVDVAHD